ncbi:MAG TPA: hypothetical protein VJ957_08000 [Longimicrobiales bacterium]|nr:hypothetical protein [Longimicrobiales bacterium]
MSASTVKKLALRVSLVLATTALFVPVKLTSEARVKANDACATGDCCKEGGSVCVVGDEIIPDAYNSATTCKPTQK